MTSGASDLRSTAAVLKRRRWVLVIAAVLGIAAGVGYVLLVPPPLTSTSLVLLPTPAVSSSSSSDVSTQVRIATSATVLGQAGKSMTPTLSTRQVEKMIDVTAPTDQIIQIDASSTDGAQAEALSQAVADAYVSYVSDTAREVTAAALADLNARRDRLREQIAQLQDEISATTKRQRKVSPDSSDGRKEAQLLAGLRTQQANLSLQLDKVEDKIVTGLGTGAGTTTSVIQPATVALGQPLPIRMLLYVPLCMLGLTLLAALFLVVSARRDPRVRYRDDIADAVGSPVLAALRSRPQRTAAGWLTLLKTYEATPVESWALRQLIRALATSEYSSGNVRSIGRLDVPHSILMVSLSGDQRGTAIGPQLAAFTASLGVATRLVTVGSHEGAETLWAACSSGRTDPANGGPILSDSPESGPVDLTVALTVLDRKNPHVGSVPEGAAAVLALGAGSATGQDLARAAVAADEAGHRIVGIVVADPDPTDRTSGRHTMDHRTRQAALPVRLTGLTGSQRTTSARRRGRP